jgi:hypothetical protein
MKRFFFNACVAGLLQYAIGFFLLGLVVFRFTEMNKYLIGVDVILVVFNIVMGTRNFIHFYKNYESNIRLRAGLNQRAHEELEILREIPREVPRPTEEPKPKEFFLPFAKFLKS